MHTPCTHLLTPTILINPSIEVETIRIGLWELWQVLHIPTVRRNPKAKFPGLASLDELPPDNAKSKPDPWLGLDR